ncbi:MAG TPA: hypothetical protein VFZ61_18450 [Polyangiales bacterium]
MSARPGAAQKRVTAQPRPISDEIGTREPPEEGLSIEPEEMGQSFLRYATEQASTETQRGDYTADLTPDSEAASDAALDSPHFSADDSVWTNTVNVAVGSGGVDDVTRAAQPPVPVDEEAQEQDWGADQRAKRGVMEIDLTESVIDEASLLDEESDVLGEVITKEPRTEDAHHKSRPR